MSESLLLSSHLKTLRLPTMHKELPTVVRQAVEGEFTYESFLERLAELEVNARQAKAIDRRLRQAGFPVVKELAEFQFQAVPKLNKKLIQDLGRCEFIQRKSNVVFLGPPGTGKSHLAIALAREACRRGHDVKFFTAAGLVNQYLEAQQERQVLRLEKQIRRRELIVVDELGYIPFTKSGAEYLFGFFSLCYERSSVIVTTNLPFAEWPQTFGGDERLTGALLDRLTHRVQIVEITGDSYRLQSSLKSRRRS